MVVEQKQGGKFFLNVNIAFVSQIFIFGLAFLFRIILARGLGDDGLGTYTLFYLTVLVAGGVGNLGVGLGNLYFINKNDYSLRVLLNNSLFALGAMAVICTIIILVYGLVTDAGAFVTGRAYWLYAPTIPVIAAYLILTSFLQGKSRFVALAVVALIQGLSALIIAAVMLFTDRLDIFGAIVAFTVSFAIADVAALVMVDIRNIKIRAILLPQWSVLWEQIRYGAKGQVANLAQLFNYRLDQFVLAIFVARAGVGHYSVAASISEGAWWISGAVATVIVPSLTRMGKKRAEEVTPVICRNTLLISIVASICLAALSPLIIPVIFGSEFSPAVRPLMLLMPGAAAVSVARVLSSYMFSQGRVIYSTYTTLIALGATIIFDFAFIPWLGIEGAAIASSIAYSSSMIAALYWYRKFSGTSTWDLLIPRASDWQLYRGVWQTLRTGLTGRRDLAVENESIHTDKNDDFK